MLTAAAIFDAIAKGRPVPGRHVILAAHPDDEVISCSAALCCLPNVLLVQVTDGVMGANSPTRYHAVARRKAERTAAHAAAAWALSVQDAGDIASRRAHEHLSDLLTVVEHALEGADVVWTHPYEGGHVDHDTCAWLAQTACQRRAKVRRLEFASYHMTQTGQVFGDFWPDRTVETRMVVLDGERYQRKLAAIQAYGSQVHILQKFPSPGREPYRVAPTYDFARWPPPPRSRWDVKGYQPSLGVWRRAIADQAVLAC